MGRAVPPSAGRRRSCDKKAYPAAKTACSSESLRRAALTSAIVILTLDFQGVPMGDKKDQHRQSFYLPEEMLEEIKGEARRLNRSVSWVVQRAWKLAKQDLRELPAA